jgi:hypothetical protein
MKLKDIYKLALNRINAKAGDKQVETVVMAGINAAIKLVATKNNKSKTLPVTVVKNIPSVLPSDFLSLSMLISSDGMKLSENNYYLDSDFLLVSDSDVVGTLTMIYNAIPLDMTLIADGDKVPDVKEIFHSAISAYGAYQYHLMTGNSNLANMFLSEFRSITGVQSAAQNQPQQQQE